MSEDNKNKCRKENMSDFVLLFVIDFGFEKVDLKKKIISEFRPLQILAEVTAIDIANESHHGDWDRV
jgi:hypothetical protein